MGLEIRLTKRAEEDLNEIFAYIAQDNPEAAERFAQKLLKRTEVLRTFPACYWQRGRHGNDIG